MGSAIRQPGVGADSRKHIRIGRAQDHRHGSARREAGHVNALGIDGVLARDVQGQGGEQRRLTTRTCLVARPEPIPAFGTVGFRGLGWIGHQESMLLGEHVHPRAGCKIIRRLRAAVEHQQQWHLRIHAVLRWHVEFVEALSGTVDECMLHECPWQWCRALVSTRALGPLSDARRRQPRKASGSQRIVDRLADLRLQRIGIGGGLRPSERDRFAGEKLG